VPESEVNALAPDFNKFGIALSLIFKPERPCYLAFVEAVDGKPAIKTIIEADAALQATMERHQETLETWWDVARDDFAQLENARNGGKKMPDVRQELLASLKGRVMPLGVLDEFKSAGVFVNWWQQIRYDLKTIVSIGWHHTLIPDEYLVAAFFQTEADEIETLEATISEAQTELDEAVETAQEVAGYEPEEGEKVTAAVIKKALKNLIDDLKDTPGKSAKKELKALTAQDRAIKKIEKRIKGAKDTLKIKTDELSLKLELKRLGGDDFKAENRKLIQQVEERLTELDPKDKADKRKITALNKDKATLQARIARTDALLTEIGGQLTPEQARQIILQKICDIVRAELDRYLNMEKRGLISSVHNLWDKYATSMKALQASRNETLTQLDQFLSGLGYKS